ncbi:MAG: malate synthase G, partial [Gammaproteobacteria bacterium]|nr:malate synthase G [Gammaproteobacteria bacterium]
MARNGRRSIGTLGVDPTFHAFVEDQLLPAIGFDSATFWRGVESIIADLTPLNRKLLKVRDDLQAKIDRWHKARRGEDWSHDEYVEFLRKIGYLQEVPDFTQVETENVDAEIASIAGPQLVVPVSNARFALNAANARWGSLYDA